MFLAKIRISTIPLTTAAAVLLVISTTCIPTRAQITVQKDMTTVRPIPPNFYGDNGQQRAATQWDQQVPQPLPPQFNISLQNLHLGVLRFPGGTGSNYWDWSVYSKPAFNFETFNGLEGGDFIGLYYGTPPSNYPSPLSELQTELGNASQPAGSTATQADFVMNVLTDPACEETPSASQCTPGNSGFGPDVAYQLDMLSTAHNNNLTISNVELGNEFWQDSEQCNVDVYPDMQSNGLNIAGQEYANLLTSQNWVGQIRTADPNVQIAAVGNYVHLPATPRSVNWNQAFFSASPLPTVDAVVLHIYTNTNLAALKNPPTNLTLNPNIPFGGPSDTHVVTAAATMLAVPFHTWDDITANYLNGNDNSSSNPQGLQLGSFKPNVWITEYNMRDTNYAAFGTWAHGLYLATMSLKFLGNSRITMATHHEAQGGPVFADILDTSTGFGAGSGPEQPSSTDPDLCSSSGGGGGNSNTLPPSTASLPTIPYDLSAEGVAQEEVNTAALGQTYATELAFSENGVPDDVPITDPTDTAYTYPSLYGWQFHGNVTRIPQVIILNLGNNQQTLDVSALADNTSTYRQISGFPGAYVLGGDQGSNGEYVAIKAAYVDITTQKSVNDNLTVTEGTLTTPTALVVPPYSITRITVQ